MINVPQCKVLKLREVGMRARSEGISISDYAIRKAVHEGQLPCRIIGKTFLISWDQFLRWITCTDNSDNPLLTEEEAHQPVNSYVPKPYERFTSPKFKETPKKAPDSYREFARERANKLCKR